MKFKNVTQNVIVVLLVLLNINVFAQNLSEKKISEYYWGAPMQKVIDDFTNNYDIRFEFDTVKIEGYKFSYSFNETSAEKALEILFRVDIGRGNTIGKEFKYYIDEDETIHITNESIKVDKTNSRYKGKSEKTNFTVSGIVRDKNTGESLPFASIFVKGTSIGSSSNVDGYFTLFKVPTDTSALEISYVGYQNTKYYLSPKDNVKQLVIYLEPNSLILDEVEVSAARTYLFVTGEKIGLIKMTPRKIANLPNIGEKDIMRSFQLMPGVSASNEASSGLYVRGGTPDQNLVLYDGFTVYHVDHLFGFFSAFNTNAIKDVQLYKGGFESKFGGRISSVVELTGKEGNQKEFNIGADLSLLSLNGFVEFPIGDKFSFIAAARRSWKSPLYTKIFDTFTQQNDVAMPENPNSHLSGTETSVSSYFYDLNSKLTFKPTNKDIFSLSFYNGTDKMDNSRIMTMRSPMGGTDTESSNQNNVIDYNNWGNTGASLKWSRNYSSKFFGNTLISYSNFFSERERSSSRSRVDDEGEETTTVRGLNEDNTLLDYSFKTDYEWKMANFNSVEFGAQVTYNDIRYSYIQNDTLTVLDRADQATTYSVYLQDRLSLFNKKLNFIPGIRCSYYDNTDKIYYEPRASLEYKINDKFKLKGAYGKYYQFTNRVVREDIMSGSREFWILSDNSSIPVSSSIHYIAGFAYETKDVLFDVEAYYKDLSGLSEYSLRFSPGIGDLSYNEYFYQGTGYSKGIDFMLQKKFGRFNGWVGYTLGEVIYDFPEISDEVFYASQNVTNEFKLVGMFKYKKWNFSATWVFANGKPYTAPEGGYEITLLDGTTQEYVTVGTKNGYQLPDYHRLDISAVYNFTLGATGSPGSLSFGIFNLYNRKNTWYKEYEIDDGVLYETDVNFLGFTPNVSLSFTIK